MAKKRTKNNLNDVEIAIMIFIGIFTIIPFVNFIFLPILLPWNIFRVKDYRISAFAALLTPAVACPWWIGKTIIKAKFGGIKLLK